MGVKRWWTFELVWVEVGPNGHRLTYSRQFSYDDVVTARHAHERANLMGWVTETYHDAEVTPLTERRAETDEKGHAVGTTSFRTVA